MSYLELYQNLNNFIAEASLFCGDNSLISQARHEIDSIADCKQHELPGRILTIRRLLIRIVPGLDHPEHNRVKQILDEILEASRKLISNPIALTHNC